MSDPRRFLDGDGTDIERDLLRAGRSERPNPFSKRRAAVALAIGATSVWPAAAYATAKAGKAGMPFLVKLFAIGAVGAGTLGTAGYVVSRSSAPTTEAVETTGPSQNPTPGAKAAPQVADPAPAPEQDPAETEEVTSPESLELEQPLDTARRAPALPATPRSSGERASIAKEIQALDEARRALASGNGAGAERALETYKQNYPRGALSEESSLLRIEALARQGNRKAARAAAERFRASHPNSPHLRRIDSLLAAP